MGIKGNKQRQYNCMPYYHGTGGLQACHALAVSSSFHFFTGPVFHIREFPSGSGPTNSSGKGPGQLKHLFQVGDTLCIGTKFQARSFWDDIRASEATYFIYVGEILRYLLAQPPSPLDKVHEIDYIYGNGLRADIWIPFRERFGIRTIHEFYNSSELMLGLSNISRNDFTAKSLGWHGALQRFLRRDSILAAVVDPETGDLVRDAKTGLVQRAPLAEGGEILTKLDPGSDMPGRNFRGYVRNEEATAKKIARDVLQKGDAWYRTGDALRRDEDGRWFFLDRLGDTFRWKGENVSTTEVAEALGEFPGVVEANVYGVQLPGHDGRAGAVALLTDETLGKDGFDFKGFLRYVGSASASFVEARYSGETREASLTLC